MIELMLTALAVVVIGGVLYWAVHKLAAAFGFPPQPVLTVFDVFLVVGAVLYLFSVAWPLIRAAVR